MKKVFFLLAAVLCAAIILSGCYGNSRIAEPGSTEDQISPIEPIETVSSTEPQVSQLQHTLQLAKQNMKSHGDEAYYVQDPDDDYYTSASLLVTNEMLSALETAPETLTASRAKRAFKNGEGYIAGDDYRIMASKDLNSYAAYYIPSGHMYYCADSCRGEYVMVDDMEIIDSANSEKGIYGDAEYLAKAYSDGTWDGGMIKCLWTGKYMDYEYVYYVGSELGIKFLYQIKLTPNSLYGRRPFCKARVLSAYGNFIGLTALNVAGESGTYLDLGVVVHLYNEGVVVSRDNGIFSAAHRGIYQSEVEEYGEIIAFNDSPANESYLLGQYDNEIWYIHYVDDLDHYLYDKYGNRRLDENGNPKYTSKQDGYLYKVIISDDGNVAFGKVPISGWHSDSMYIPPRFGENFSFIDADGNQRAYTISGDTDYYGYEVDDRKIVEIK